MLTAPFAQILLKRRSRMPRGRERLEALLAGIARRQRTDRPARAEAMAAMRRQLGLDGTDQ